MRGQTTEALFNALYESEVNMALADYEQRLDGFQPFASDPTLRAILTHGRPEVLRHYGIFSCVVSTRVAIETLKVFGFYAVPMSVEVAVTSVTHPEEYPVAIEFTVDEKGPIGHLVAWLPTEQVIFDLSADQLSRPERHLTMTPIALEAAGTGFPELPARWTSEETGVAITYQQHHGPKWWTSSPNWGSRDADVRRQIVRETVAQVRKHLKALGLLGEELR